MSQAIQIQQHKSNRQSFVITSILIAILLIIFFYIIYVLEYIIKGIKYKDFNKAYYNISFEKEAYKNEKNLNYNKDKKIYSFIKYIRDNE